VTICGNIGVTPDRAVGIGLRGPHLREIMLRRPAVGWLEVHPENYFANAPALAALQDLRRDYPLSLHGVGLSLGSAEGISETHLQALGDLIAAVEPALLSEHLSFSVAGEVYHNDLLPLPYTEEALLLVADNIAWAQDALRRRILIENPSVYLRFRHSPIPEPEFLAELCRRTGCGILCDVNNAYVCAENFGLDAGAWLAALPVQAVGEIHLAGHHRGAREGRPLLVDDHGTLVAPPVWSLYEAAIARFGVIPALIEWDRNLPPLDTLLGEAGAARERLVEAVGSDHVFAA